jgi:hypothetical protein
MRKRHWSAVWQSILFTGSRFSSCATSDAASLRVVWLTKCADPGVLKRGENDWRTAWNGLRALLLLLELLELLELALALALPLVVAMGFLSKAYFL